MDGLKGDSKESWEECESSVNSMLKERLVKQNVEIERAHRVRRKSRNKLRKTVRKLLQFKGKPNILRKAKILKETDIFVNEDCSKHTAGYIKELSEEVKLLQSQGKIAYLNYRTVVSRDKSSTPSSKTEISENWYNFAFVFYSK